MTNRTRKLSILVALAAPMLIGAANLSHADSNTDSVATQSDQTTALNAARINTTDAYSGTTSNVVGDAGNTSGSHVWLTQDLTIRCKRDSGHEIQFKSGTVFKRVSSCNEQSFNVEMCNASRDDGRSCGADDWSDPVTVTKGETVKHGSTDLTLQKCDNGVCQLTVRQDQKISVNPDSSKTEGQQRIKAMQSESDNYTAQGVFDLGSSPQYTTTYNGAAQTTAKDSQNIVQGAARGRIVAGDGTDLGALQYATQDCPTTCLKQSTKTVTKTESCTQATSTRSYACIQSYATAACITQPKTKDETCKQIRDIEYAHCDFQWPDHLQPPTRKCSKPVFQSAASNASLNAGWKASNTFNQTYSDTDQLVSWTRGYTKDNGFKTEGDCPASTNDACKFVQQDCTLQGPGSSDGVVADYACLQRNAVFACRTGGTTNTCSNDGTEGGSACKKKTLTCDNHRVIDTKVCHTERSRILPAFSCPVKFDHLSQSNICIGRKTCPEDYQLNDQGQCVLPDDDYCKQQSYTPDARSFIDIVSQTFTDPHGNPIDARANFHASNDEFVLDYRTTHHRTYCNTGWNYTLKFRVKDIRELHAFILRETRWNDHQDIFVNGTKIYSSPGSCTGGNDGSAMHNEDLKSYMHQGINTLHIKGTSGPTKFVMFARFVVQRECTFGGTCPYGKANSDDPTKCTTPGTPLNTSASKYRDGFDSGKNPISCKLASHTDDPNDFTYDCGQRSAATSTCTSDDLAGYTAENKFNEKTNKAGKLISWDQLYTKDDHFVGGACRADQPGSSCKLISTTCSEQGPQKLVNGVPVKRDCFAHKMTYQCDSGFNAGACQNQSPAGSCTESGSHCIVKDPDTGACLGTQTDYICKNQIADEQCNGHPAQSQRCTSASTSCVEKDQYGNCLSTKTTRTCYDGNTDKCNSRDNCTFQSQKCVDEENGICMKVSQTYSCKSTETTCTQTQAMCSNGSSDKGMGSGFNTTVSGLSKVDAMLKNMDTSNSTDIRIMSGKPASCTDDLVGDPIAAKCCKKNANESGFFDSCTQEEKDLAAARRADRTHFVDKYCSKKINLGFTKICIAKRQTYCQFPSLLARLVQEQGRQQLAHMSSAGDSQPDVEKISTPYMSTTPGWQHSITVGGQPVYIWTWDKACKTDPTKAYTQAGMVCPASNEVWIAYCRSGSCNPATLSNPMTRNPDSGWGYASYDAAGDKSVSLGRSAELAGHCDAVANDSSEPQSSGSNAVSFDQCHTTITSWATAKNGNAQVSMDISWQLFHPEGNPEHWTSSTKAFGRFKFQPYQADPVSHDGEPRSMPATVPLRVSVDDGPFQTIQVPTKTPEDGFPLNTSPSSRLFGSCDPQLNWCDMKVIAQTQVGPRPFCTKGECHKSDLDCRGFTMQEFAVLDFSKMDLDEYTSSLSPNVPSSSSIQAQATSTEKSFEQSYANNTQVDQTSNSQAVMHITPTDGRPPWKARLSLVAEYPRNDGNVDVDRIHVEWGDGQSTDITPTTNSSLVRTHTYQPSSGYRDFYVTATYYLATGQVRTVRAKLNSWKDTPPVITNQYGGGGGSASTYQPSATAGGQSGSDLPSPKPSGN